jgi:beta-lactamase superfamily II metal-dependent hydrolase
VLERSYGLPSAPVGSCGVCALYVMGFGLLLWPTSAHVALAAWARTHHGSITSTSQLLLATVRPQLAVISVGRVNRYGHPAPLVLARLAAHGIQVRRTDREGTLVIEAARDGSWRVRSGAEGF